jgi:uncharacterized iron-regulated membrane protein
MGLLHGRDVVSSLQRPLQRLRAKRSRAYPFHMRLPSKQELRRLWFTIHKWLGLCLAIPVVLIFLSGSLLVWKASVDDLLHPQRRVSASPAQLPTFYAAAAQRALAPGERMVSLAYPRSRGAVVVTAASARDGQMMSGQVRYFLDPTNGRVLDSGPMYSRPLGLLHVLHGSLLLGLFGGRIVGAIAITLLLSAFSGLWLWWPMKGPLICGMRWGRTQSTNANLHHLAGFWFAVPLVVLALTGATISFARFFNNLVGDTAAVRAEGLRASAAPLLQPRMILPQVLAAAGSPRDLVSITWPTTQNPEWSVTLKAAGGSTVAAVDDRNGKASAQNSRPPETTARLMRRIHDGTGMPVVWQIVIFVTGLLGATMAVTGVIMWLKGQTREVRMRRQRADRAAR